MPMKTEKLSNCLNEVSPRVRLARAYPKNEFSNKNKFTSAIQVTMNLKFSSRYKNKLALSEKVLTAISFGCRLAMQPLGSRGEGAQWGHTGHCFSSLCSSFSKARYKASVQPPPYLPFRKLWHRASGSLFS